jgi:hypothetical protein
MRVNIYSQELTDEVNAVSKVSNTGIEYKAIQFVLHSSPMLHHPPADDDRSAVTFWLPQSDRGLREFRCALIDAVKIVDAEYQKFDSVPEGLEREPLKVGRLHDDDSLT